VHLISLRLLPFQADPSLPQGAARCTRQCVMPVACELKIVAATIKITAITAIPYSIANPCRINRFIAFVLLPERILDEPNLPSRKRRTNLNVIFPSLHFLQLGLRCMRI
jgi:hypothetical protein